MNADSKTRRPLFSIRVYPRLSAANPVFDFFRSLLRNSRKTECCAKQFLIRLKVRSAPFALLRNSLAQGRAGPVRAAKASLLQPCLIQKLGCDLGSLAMTGGPLPRSFRGLTRC